MLSARRPSSPCDACLDSVPLIHHDEAAVAHLLRPVWQWSYAELRRQHGHYWPAAYQGDVWILVVPAEEWSRHRHVIHLAWGPWERRVDVILPASGLVLVTGKGFDDRKILCELNCDRALAALFGLGPLADDVKPMNMKVGWSPRS